MAGTGSRYAYFNISKLACSDRYCRVIGECTRRKRSGYEQESAQKTNMEQIEMVRGVVEAFHPSVDPAD